MSHKIKSTFVDLGCKTEGCNMYGCQPCPKCDNVFRHSGKYPIDESPFIKCDACGLIQAAEIKDE